MFDNAATVLYAIFVSFWGEYRESIILPLFIPPCDIVSVPKVSTHEAICCKNMNQERSHLPVYYVLFMEKSCHCAINVV